MKGFLRLANESSLTEFHAEFKPPQPCRHAPGMGLVLLRRTPFVRILYFPPQMRQEEPENGSLAGLRLHPDPAAVHLDDGLGDRQPQAGSADLTGEGRIHLEKLFEKPLVAFL